MADKEKLNLKDSKLILQGTPTEQSEWEKRIDERREDLVRDQGVRKTVYRVRRDMYVGDQGSYTNIVGLVRKEKKGHNNAVVNYAGKTAVKICYGLANNPPKLTIPSLDALDDIENNHSQGVEDYIDICFNDPINRFWKKGYRRAVFNQVVVGDAALKIYPVIEDRKIKIINHEAMENIMVGWRGDDPTEFDFVIAECYRTVQSIYEEFGIKVPEKLVSIRDAENADPRQTSSHDSNQWGTRSIGTGRATLPTGKNDLPAVKLVEYDDENTYAIKIAGELVQLIFKDDVNFPKVKFWVIIPNIPNPNSPWSIADIDYLIDTQVEYNDVLNHSKDYIRVGATQRYVAYNISDLDPESISTSSGQVINIESTDGTSRLEPLQTNVNNFPADTYLRMIQGNIYDLGLPRVTYGVSGTDSGRSKAIDYQSMVDLIIFKRDAWELALQQICEKIQIFGHFLRPDLEIFSDKEGNFVVRNAEFDWSEILPVTAADKIVNMVNKLQAGLPYSEYYKELGYRNVDQIIAEMKKEAQDTDLMVHRSKMWQLTEGITKASQMAGMGQEGEAPSPNQAAPTLTASQNEGRDSSLPVSQSGGTTSYSTPKGMIARARQNLTAQGR